MPADYTPALRAAVAAAEEAGALLYEEFVRPDGPRGDEGKCPADNEAELLIRRVLDDFEPSFGLIGEEFPHRNRAPDDPAGHVWLVDPNDGTSRMQRGHRGAAVSIGLLRNGEPVLGVVHAYAARAGRGDLIAWAEGLQVRRNGVDVPGATWGAVSEANTVLVSPAAERSPARNARACAPARFRTIASPAYRLALVAVGEGVAATCLGGPDNYDVGAGHALLRSVGGELYRAGGAPVHYQRNGDAEVGDFAAGHPDFARDLAMRLQQPARAEDADLVVPPPVGTPGLGLTEPDKRVTVTDPDLLDRAQGVLVGQFAGDALGSLVEFQGPERIRARYGESGPDLLVDGGTFGTLAGQPTDDSEMALALARTLVADRRYDPENVARAYAAWADSGPFDIGITTGNALTPAARAVRDGRSAVDAARGAASTNTESQANGALMRVSPLALFAHRLADEEIASLARTDAALTHSHSVCGDANAVYCVALAAALRGRLDSQQTYDYALGWARRTGVEEPVLNALQEAAAGPPPSFMEHKGWVLLALRNAFHQLLAAPDPTTAVVATVRFGGDTDTNAAIAGALLGAVYGGAAFAHQWQDRLATCRPLRSHGDGAWTTDHPRPQGYWPVDHLVLSERLAFLAPQTAPQPR